MTDDAAIRQKLYAWILREQRSLQMGNFIAFELGKQRGNPVSADEEKRAYELFHELEIRGVIMPDHSQLQSHVFYEVTSKGADALTANDLLAVDPKGFVARARAEASLLDAAAFEYLADAVRCLDAWLARPASVMLGVAAEIAAMQLAAALVAAAAPNEARQWEGERSVAVRWRRALELARSSGYLQRLSAGDARHRETLRELDDRQDALLALIRLERNDAGHALTPTADEDVARAFVRAAPRLLAVLSAVLGLVQVESAKSAVIKKA